MNILKYINKYMTKSLPIILHIFLHNIQIFISLYQKNYFDQQLKHIENLFASLTNY